MPCPFPEHHRAPSGGGGGLAALAVVLVLAAAAVPVAHAAAAALAAILEILAVTAGVVLGFGGVVLVVVVRRRRAPRALPGRRPVRAAVGGAGKIHPARAVSAAPTHADLAAAELRAVTAETALRHVLARPDLSPASALVIGRLADAAERERGRL